MIPFQLKIFATSNFQNRQLSNVAECWTSSWVCGVTTGCILPIGYSVLLPWIQTSLSLKPEIVFNRVKELFEPIVLRKKNRRFLLFLKAFSWETDLWVTVGEFKVKTAELGREICFKPENQLSWNECAVLQIITIICVTHVQKNFEIRTSNKQLLTKYQIFTKLPQIPNIHINCNF